MMHVCARVLVSRVHRDWCFEAFVDVKLLGAGDDLLSSAAGKPHLRDSSPVPRRRPLIYIYRHTPSGESRVEKSDASKPSNKSKGLGGNIGCRDKSSTVRGINRVPQWSHIGSTV